MARIDRDKLTLEQRCSAIASGSGERCRNPHMVGTTVCRTHSRNAPQIIAKADRARVSNEIQSRMARLVTPIDREDPDARGDFGLITEICRTVARVRALDEWIVDLREEQLGWNRVEGVKETESTEMSMSGSFGESDTTTRTSKRKVTFEMRINVYVEWQMRERTHLASLYKIWLAAGFKQRELDMLERHLFAYNNAMLNILRALGIDANAPEVKQIIHHEMLTLSSPA